MRGARLVSLVFQPVVTLSVVLAGIAAAHAAWRSGVLVLWLLLAVLPALALAAGMAAGVWSDIEITELRERRTFLPLCAGLACAAGVWADAAHMPAPLRLVAWAVAGWLVVSSVVSLWWKISLHEGATVGAVCLAAYLLGVWAAGALAWAPLLVAWARLRLERHTPAQLAAGAAVAVAAFAVAYLAVGG